MRWLVLIVSVVMAASMNFAAPIMSSSSKSCPPGLAAQGRCPSPPAPTPTPSPTPTPTATASRSASPAPTPSPSPRPTPTPSPTPSGGDVQPSFPIRAAFFYPWFPESWNQQGYNPFTWYHPSTGFYDSSDPTIIAGQIDAMLDSRIQVGISSWWGQGTATDGRVSQLLAGVGTGTFRWTLYYEQEGSSNPTSAQISSDLSYILANYGTKPGYLRIGGKPVIFVYGDASDACGMVDRWNTANAGRFYVVLKVFSGYRTCASQPQSWHQYAPAVAEDHQAGFSFSISPGFWKRSESTPRLARDLNRWQTNVADMVASKEPWQLITTFSEWGEGTQVESATEYGTQYLDVLAGANPSPTPTPSPTVTPNPTPTPSTPPGSVVITAAGDIACDPGSNSGAPSSCDQNGTANLIATINPDAVLTLGDNQYEQGALSAFQNVYGPSWGRFFSKTKPSIGNHEYLTSGASGYFGYFGSLAGDPAKGYYSYNLGSWHLISLNSECSHVGGCASGNPQEVWLRNDLASNTTQCVLAYWHEPRWSNGQHGNATQMATIWNDLVAAHADIVLSGHNHDYERYGPMDSNGALSGGGVREFVVGTGGKNHYPISAPMLPAEQVQNDSTFGVLKLTLSASSYSWSFVPAAGYSFTDSGSGACS